MLDDALARDDARRIGVRLRLAADGRWSHLACWVKAGYPVVAAAGPGKGDGDG